MRLFLATLILAAGLPAQGAKAPVKIVGDSHKPILFSAFGVTAEGQGAGDSDLGGDFGPALPTTETIELRIVVEPGKELACGDEIVNGFCEKSDEQSLAIGGRASGGRVGREVRRQREKADYRGQQLTGRAQGSDDGFEKGEEVTLEDGVELREQDGRVNKLHGALIFEVGTCFGD